MSKDCWVLETRGEVVNHILDGDVHTPVQATIYKPVLSQVQKKTSFRADRLGATRRVLDTYKNLVPLLRAGKGVCHVDSQQDWKVYIGYPASIWALLVPQPGF